jgi:hypothetical protein
MKINKEQLETILIAHWTEFLNPREILNMISTQTDLTIKNSIKNVKVTRCEFINNKFIIWVEFNYNLENILLELETDYFNNIIIKNILR